MNRLKNQEQKHVRSGEPTSPPHPKKEQRDDKETLPEDGAAGQENVRGVGSCGNMALVLGAGTAAVAATGGNFILGKSNVAGAVSKLTAK